MRLATPHTNSRLHPPPAERDARAPSSPTSGGSPRTLSDFVEVPLTKGYVAVVDAADAWVLRWKWSTSISRRGHVYAVRRNHSVDGQRISVSLHQMLLGKPPKGIVIDHIDGDTLNNRRNNLRIVSHLTNCWNISGTRSGNTSGTLGVSFDRAKKKWRATIIASGRCYRGKWFADKAKAAEDRLRLESELWGVQPRRAHFFEFPKPELAESAK